MNQQQMSVKPTNRLLWVVLGVVVLAVGGGIWYAVAQNYGNTNTSNNTTNANTVLKNTNSVSQNTNNENINTTPTPTTNTNGTRYITQEDTKEFFAQGDYSVMKFSTVSTLGWKRYENTLSGYSFLYPPDAKVEAGTAYYQQYFPESAPYCLQIATEQWSITMHGKGDPDPVVCGRSGVGGGEARYEQVNLQIDENEYLGTFMVVDEAREYGDENFSKFISMNGIEVGEGITYIDIEGRGNPSAVGAANFDKYRDTMLTIVQSLKTLN